MRMSLSNEELCTLLLLDGWHKVGISGHHRFTKGNSKFIFEKKYKHPHRFLVQKHHQGDAKIYTDLRQALEIVGIKYDP